MEHEHGTLPRFPLRETLFFGTFLAFYLVPVQVTKLYLHFFTAYFRARRILPFHLLPPPFPPLGTSLPGGKLRPLEGSAPFLGWAADDHVRASHGGNTHGRRDKGRRRQKARVVAKPAHFAKKHDFLLKNTKIPQPD